MAGSDPGRQEDYKKYLRTVEHIVNKVHELKSIDIDDPQNANRT